jgi:hypothetical protein
MTRTMKEQHFPKGEEAGEETVTTIIASLKPVNREDFDQAVKALVRLGLVIQSETPTGSGGSLILTEAGRKGLTI